MLAPFPHSSRVSESWLGRGLSLFFLCLCGFSLVNVGTLLQSKDVGVKLFGDSQLTLVVNVGRNGNLCLYAGPTIRLPPVSCPKSTGIGSSSHLQKNSCVDNGWMDYFSGWNFMLVSAHLKLKVCSVFHFLQLVLFPDQFYEKQLKRARQSTFQINFESLALQCCAWTTETVLHGQRSNMMSSNWDGDTVWMHFLALS